MQRPGSRRPTTCGSSSLIGGNSVFARSGCALVALGLTPLAGSSFPYRAEGLRKKRSITVPQPAAPSVPLKRLVHGDCIHHPVHRRMRAVLDLDPMLGPAGLIRSILVLRAKRSRLQPVFPIGIVNGGRSRCDHLNAGICSAQQHDETKYRQKHKSAPELLALLERPLRNCLFE